MNRLHFWIGLAILGFLLYLAPAFFVRRMYEGFTDEQGQQEQQGQTKDISQLLEAVQGLAAGISDTPSLESPTAAPLKQETQGARRQPDEYTSQRSQPASPRDVQKPSEALKQGTGFLVTKPYPADTDRQHRLNTLAKEDASQEESQPLNDNCPDMRDYIRKDKIPCWACNLK